MLVNKNYNFPKISPILNTKRPFWSVMIPTYNGNHYLKQTIQSVLQQDPGEELMHIEIVDDCSTEENPELILQEIGTNRISVYRQTKNVGQIANWNTCIQRAQGQWIHILHQDDLVLPGFYQHLQKLLEKNKDVGAAFCRHAHIDENNNELYLSTLERKSSGILTNWIELIAVYQRLQFPSIVVKRETYEQIGGFSHDAFSAADWEMWKRIAANYSIAFEPKKLAYFRLHSASESSRLIKSGANIIHVRAAINVTQSYLPPVIAQPVSRKAKKHYALYAIKTAKKLLIKKDFKAAIAQIREALKCFFSR
ncbi:MAG: glycosyltransferase family 2 protein [Xenococcaceae cyanobacterium]